MRADSNDLRARINLQRCRLTGNASKNPPRTPKIVVSERIAL